LPRVGSPQNKSMIKEIQIELGTVFTISERYLNEFRTNVVTDPGEEKWFQSGILFQDEKGLNMIAPGGTGGIEDVKEIVGKMKKEEVIEAMKRFWVFKHHRDFPKELLDDIEKCAEKGSRILGS